MSVFDTFLNWSVFRDSLPMLLAGLWVTVGLGATAIRATTAVEVRDALADTRDTRGPVVLVVPTVPHADLPGGDVWWDVAPAEVSGQEWVQALRAEYEQARGAQRWFG